MTSAGPLLLSGPSRLGVRRLSSMTATRENLATGPTVVVPPKHMMAPIGAHETAAALEMAKHSISETGYGQATPTTPPVSAFTDTYAFAFDIDGVLVRGRKPIPEAVEAMKMLNGDNEWGVKV